MTDIKPPNVLWQNDRSYSWMVPAHVSSSPREVMQATKIP